MVVGHCMPSCLTAAAAAASIRGCEISLGLSTSIDACGSPFHCNLTPRHPTLCMSDLCANSFDFTLDSGVDDINLPVFCSHFVSQVMSDVAAEVGSQLWDYINDRCDPLRILSPAGHAPCFHFTVPAACHIVSPSRHSTVAKPVVGSIDVSRAVYLDGNGPTVGCMHSCPMCAAASYCMQDMQHQVYT